MTTLRLNLEKNAKAFNYWADRFEKLGLYFMSFHGAQTIYDVINVSTLKKYDK